MLGTTATIVMPRTAPPLKVENIRALGAEVVLCDVSERFEIAAKICAERGAVLQGLITVTPETKVCFLLSGGSVGLDQLDILKKTV